MPKAVEIRTDLHYSAARGGLLRELQHDLQLPSLLLRCLWQ
jgi:hypothetical protein